MAEPRDVWAKVDIAAKVALPILIFALGTMYSCHQKAIDDSAKSAERIATYVRSLYSDKPGERQYALAMLEIEKKKHPDEVGDFTSKVVPSLFIAANDENPQVSAQAQKLITEITKEADPQVGNAMRESLTQVTANTQWSAVIGGDGTIEAAQSRVQKAKELNYPEVIIYKKKNSYRTVIKFPSKQEADSKIGEIQAKLNKGAYVVNLDRWCLNPVDKNGFYDCQNED